MSIEETKGDSGLESKKYVEEIAKAMRVDSDRYGSKSRFGYFSIPHSSSIGDGFYSQNMSKVYRTEDRKVVTEQRGIFTRPIKKGKGPDAFFSNAFKEEKQTLARVKEMADEERKDLLNVVKSRKKGADNEGSFKASFKPTGPQEFKDFYDINPVRYNQPVNKEIDKKTKIDKEHNSVFTEKRGIMTNPPKLGSSTTPGILFSSFKDDKKLLQLKEKIAEDEKNKHKRSRSANEENNDDRLAFKPAALKKNEPFQTDNLLYGEDDKKVKVLLQNMIESKHKGKQKYSKQLPTGAVKQDRAFRPAALVKTGTQALFKPVYGVPFIGHEKSPPKKHDKNAKAFRKNFTYNRLVDSTVFSPPVSSFLPNLKKEFPSVFRK